MTILSHLRILTNLNKSVVQDEHDGSEIPRPLLAPKEHLSNIANIANFGMPQAKLPQDDGTIK
jgi:hypothetical protein